MLRTLCPLQALEDDQPVLGDESAEDELLQPGLALVGKHLAEYSRVAQLEDDARQTVAVNAETDSDESILGATPVDLAVNLPPNVDGFTIHRELRAPLYDRYTITCTKPQAWYMSKAEKLHAKSMCKSGEMGTYCEIGMLGAHRRGV